MRAILDSILRNLINIGLGAAGLPGILCIATISERSIFISSFLCAKEIGMNTIPGKRM
jgi:hypothetical protein